MSKKVDATWLMSQITENLLSQLATLPAPPDKLVIAFSGGVDSSFLLHSLISAKGSFPGLPEIHGVYVNHGLSPSAANWQLHCEDFCTERGIPFEAISVNLDRLPRTSLEATAREARYHALLRYCQQQNGALVLGQHQDDQAETLLLALKRGSGPAGLAGMQAHSMREGIHLFRPLLGISREQIESAAKMLQLVWVNDESNDDNRFDRNFLRNIILPALQQRWPQFSAAVGKSCELLQEQNALLAEVTEERFQSVHQADGTVAVDGILNVTPAWQRALIRHWLRINHKVMPSRAQLQEILGMLTAREDACPTMRAADYVIRRYNQRLYITESQLPSACKVQLETAKIQCLSWWPVPFRVAGEGDWQALPAITFDKLQVLNNAQAKSPRKWFKEWKVPPWLRENVPVITLRGDPVAVLLTDRVIYLAEFHFGTSEVRHEIAY